MAWEVEYTDEFEEWFDGLSLEEQRRVGAAVDALATSGPGLGRPHVDTIKSLPRSE